MHLDGSIKILFVLLFFSSVEMEKKNKCTISTYL